MIPYSRQAIDDADIEAVVAVLQSDWLTTGPKVAEFEAAFATYAGATHAVAVNSGTAALHAVMHARGVGSDDEVIVPANTFVASANCVVYQGGTPVFADIDAETLVMDPRSVAEKITPRTKGIIAVDFAGLPCDYEALRALAEEHGLFLHADACHALGASYNGRPVGGLATTSSFSFHPVKPITTAEGGMITTDDETLASSMRIFRNHGLSSDFRQREKAQTWEYDMVDLGWNYRLSDFQCALGLSQLRKADEFFARRNAVADRYDEAFEDLEWLQTPARLSDRTHAFHLYACQLTEAAPFSQRDVFQTLRAKGIGVHVMYRPVYLHSYYQKNFEYAEGTCPVAEQAYRRILTLPVSPAMTEADVASVVDAVRTFPAAYSSLS